MTAQPELFATSRDGYGNTSFATVPIAGFRSSEQGESRRQAGFSGEGQLAVRAETPRPDNHPLPPFVASSATSEAAAASISPCTADRRAKVLAFIRSCGSAGATDSDGQRHFGWSGSSYTPRRIELERAGLVMWYGEKRKTASGRDAGVFMATTV